MTFELEEKDRRAVSKQATARRDMRAVFRSTAASCSASLSYESNGPLKDALMTVMYLEGQFNGPICFSPHRTFDVQTRAFLVIMLIDTDNQGTNCGGALRRSEDDKPKCTHMPTLAQTNVDRRRREKSSLESRRKPARSEEDGFRVLLS